MLISKAYAAAADAVSATPAAPGVPGAPSPGNVFLTNIVMAVTLIVLFYVLMILPQQKRFKEHSKMLSGLRKGDKVVTGGGIVGTIDKITDGSDEVVVDLGNGIKVTALRSTLQTQSSNPLLRDKASNDQKDKK